MYTEQNLGRGQHGYKSFPSLIVLDQANQPPQTDDSALF